MHFQSIISPDFGIADHFIDRAVNVDYISNHRPIFKNLTNQKKMDCLKARISLQTSELYNQLTQKFLHPVLEMTIVDYIEQIICHTLVKKMSNTTK